jgi:thioredoxin 1
MASLEAVTDDSFEAKVLKAGEPVLVDFWAEWCGPCKAMAPAVEDLSREYEGELKVYTLDVDKNPQIKERYQVKSIPFFLVFKNGEVVETHRGATSRTRLAALIEAALGSAR